MMIYTSGTTGQPKGALHAHRVLLGHLPGVQMPHEFLPQPGDRLWTPADWAWAGGLLNVLLPGLHFGVPVVARKFEKFDPEEAFRLMADLEVRNAFIPPTALRMLRTVAGSARSLRSRACAPSARVARAWRGADIRMGARGARPDHQRILRPDRMQSRPLVMRGDRHRQAGAIGKPVPGHRVAIIRDGRHAVRAGRTRPDRRAPARPGDVPRILEQCPTRRAAKFIGDWMTTGDQGERRRRRLCPLRRPRRRRHHLGRLPHRSGRDRGLPDPPSGRGARRRASASPIRCAPRSSRPSSC